MKCTGIFIDFRNKKQVRWWNRIARRFVKVVEYGYIREDATGKNVGALVFIDGLFKNYVIKKNNKKFIHNGSIVKFTK